MNTNETLSNCRGDGATGFGGATSPTVDVVLAEARRLRAQETSRLLRAGLRQVGRITISLIAPIFGWNRRHPAPRLPYDRHASITAHIKALRADAETGKRDHWLGHSA